MVIAHVKGQALKIVQPIIASDTIDYLEMRVVFETSDWEGLEKNVHFSKGNTAYQCTLSANNTIEKNQHMNLPEGNWNVFISGVRVENGKVTQRITTIGSTLTVKSVGGPIMPFTPPSDIERIEAEIGNLSNLPTQDKTNLVAAIYEIYNRSGGDSTYVHNQLTASQTWIVHHNLGKHPSVQIVDSGGTAVVGEIRYTNQNEVSLHFAAPFSGKAYLN